MWVNPRSFHPYFNFQTTWTRRSQCSFGRWKWLLINFSCIEDGRGCFYHTNWLLLCTQLQIGSGVAYETLYYLVVGSFWESWKGSLKRKRASDSIPPAWLCIANWRVGHRQFNYYYWKEGVVSWSRRPTHWKERGEDLASKQSERTFQYDLSKQYVADS